MELDIRESNLQFTEDFSYCNYPKRAVWHNSDHPSCTIVDIHSWHLQNGWIGCGYHYVIDKEGIIWKGRPENAMGAHCPGQNASSIGICCVGRYMVETSMPDAQYNALIALTKMLMDKYGMNEVNGHNYYYSTDCPGINFPLSAARNAVFSGDVPTSSVISKPQMPARSWLQPGDRNDKVTALQSNLNKLGFNCGEVDGIYGSLAYNAVSEFQSTMGLSVDGCAGNATFAAINEIMSMPVDWTGAGHYEYATRYIQWRLGIGIDGIFMGGTANAVMDWQKNHNLDADGIVGGATWNSFFY